MNEPHRNPRANVPGSGIDEPLDDRTSANDGQSIPERSEDETQDEANDGEDVDEGDEEGEDEDEALERR